MSRLLDCFIGFAMFGTFPVVAALRESRRDRQDRRFVRSHRAF